MRRAAAAASKQGSHDDANENGPALLPCCRGVPHLRTRLLQCGLDAECCSQPAFGLEFGKVHQQPLAECEDQCRQYHPRSDEAGQTEEAGDAHAPFH